MKRQHQTIFGDKKGNCWSTCIACILNLKLQLTGQQVSDAISDWVLATHPQLSAYEEIGCRVMLGKARPGATVEVLCGKPKAGAK